MGARAGLLASERGVGRVGGLPLWCQGCRAAKQLGAKHIAKDLGAANCFHDLSVFKVTRTEVITLPSLTIVHYDHSHFLVCLFYDLPLFLCKQETFNNSSTASLQLQLYGWSDAQ